MVIDGTCIMSDIPSRSLVTLFYKGSLVYSVCHGLGLFDAVPSLFWPW